MEIPEPENGSVTVVIDSHAENESETLESLRNRLNDISFSFEREREEWRTRTAELEERLANQPPAVTVEIQNVQAQPEPEPEPQPEALSISEPIAELTETEMEALESVGEVDQPGAAIEIAMEEPPLEVNPSRSAANRGILARLFLGTRRS